MGSIQVYLLHKLHGVENAAARIGTNCPRICHMY